MALPGNRGAVQVIRRVGPNTFHAHMAGAKAGINLAHPEVHVHLKPGVQYDPGDGTPHVDLHDAFHNNPKSLPPGLMAIIMAAVEAYMEQHGMREQAAAATRPTPPMPMMGGLPGNRMPMAA